MLIGEVSSRSGVSARMLRHYDALGLVSPTARTTGGYRQYAEADIRRLFLVEGLRSLGLGLREIADALTDASFRPGDLIDGLIARSRERLAREQELLRVLGQVQAGAPDEWSDVLHTVGLMRGLAAEDASERQRFALGLDAGTSNVAPIVEAALDETDLNVAGALDWALAQSGDAAVRLLADALDSPLASRRHRAVETLRKIGSSSALDALADAHEHPDPRVRGRAGLIRGARGDTSAIPALVGLVVDGTDDVEAADVLAVLAAHRSGRAAVLAAMEGALAVVEGAGRQRLTAALADVPGVEVEAVLNALVEDSDRGVALTATALLRSRQAGDAAR